MSSYLSNFIQPNSSIVITNSKIHARLGPLDTIEGGISVNINTSYWYLSKDTLKVKIVFTN